MKQRIITGIIAAAIFIPIVYFGGTLFDVTLILLGVIGMHEFYKMRQLQVISPYGIVSFLVLILLIAPYSFYDMLSLSVNKEDLFIGGGLILLAITVTSKNKFSFDDASFVLTSILYVSAGFAFMILTRSEGLSVFLFPLFIIWATDSGAYFTGRAIGRNKLWPEISPNKTIEGFFGGIAFGLLVAAVFYFLNFIDLPLSRVIGLSIFISVAGQFGDLVQSAFKRHYGIKDSGNFLPGHGGILDRFDSLIYVMPMFYYLLFSL